MPTSPSPARITPERTEPSVRIAGDDMFAGDIEQFEDTFGGEPGGLTIAGFLHLAAREGRPIRIEIIPPAS